MDLCLPSKIPWDIVNLSAGVDEKVDNFNDLFVTCLDQHAPISLSNSNTNPILVLMVRL